jgi:hypothetical protein
MKIQVISQPLKYAGIFPFCQTLPGATDVPATDTRVGKVVRDDLVGVTAADAAAIAAEADIVVEFPFSGVPGNKTLTFKVSFIVNLLQIRHDLTTTSYMTTDAVWIRNQIYCTLTTWNYK